MSDEVRVAAECYSGATRYTIEDDGPLNVKVTRLQGNGKQDDFWLPRKLIIKFAFEYSAPKLVSALRKLVTD